MNFTRTLFFSMTLLGLIATGAKAGQLKVPKHYPTIQAAVDVALAGDVVVVSKGIHAPFSVLDKKNITVVGKKGAQIDIEAAGEGIHLFAADGFIIRGLRIRKTADLLEFTTGILVEKTSGGLIEKCRFTASPYGLSAGVEITAESYGVTVRQNRFMKMGLGISVKMGSHGCVLEKNTFRICLGFASIYVDSCQFTTVRSNHFRTGFCDYMITVWDSSDTLVHDNRMSHCFSGGVGLFGNGVRNHILENRMKKLGGDISNFGAISIEIGMTDLQVRSNKVRDFYGDGIQIEGSGLHVGDNVLRDVTDYGIWLEDTANKNEITGNRMKRCEYGLYVEGGKNLIRENKARKSEKEGLFEDPTASNNVYLDNDFDL